VLETVLVTGYYPAEPRPSRHIAWANRAVLLVDIAESVRLIEQDESGVISRWIDFVEQVRTDVLPRHGGRLVKSLGDECFWISVKFDPR
jgi:adenylate cyclase